MLVVALHAGLVASPSVVLGGCPPNLDDPGAYEDGGGKLTTTLADSATPKDAREEASQDALLGNDAPAASEASAVDATSEPPPDTGADSGLDAGSTEAGPGRDATADATATSDAARDTSAQDAPVDTAPSDTGSGHPVDSGSPADAPHPDDGSAKG